MRSFRTVGVITTFAAALLVAAGAIPRPASAASTVDVTYDLSNSTVEALTGLSLDKVFFISNSNPVNGAIAGSMKIRYASNSQSSMPISPGPVSLLSFGFTVQSLTILQVLNSGTGSPKTLPYPYLSGSLRWQLAGGPLAGSLTSGGAIAGLTGSLHLTGTLKCIFPISVYCPVLFGIPGGVSAMVNRYYSGAFGLAGSIGAYGGAQSTQATLTGQGPVPIIQGVAFAIGTGVTHNGFGGANLVGREVLREAEGHPPKPIPEPGTLLLLGAGTAGLALIGRATRRSRRS